MESGADVDADPLDGPADLRRRLDRPSRTVESREESVADVLDLATVESLHDRPGHRVVLVQHLTPARVAAPNRVFGRSDDIREQDRGEHPVGGCFRACAGDEFLHLCYYRLDVAGVRVMIVAGQLDV